MAGPSAREPAPDPAAIREATRFSRVEGRYVSARSVSHYLRSSLALEAGDEATALAELRLAVLYDPTSVHLRYRLAEELVARGQQEKAERSIRELLERHPGHVPSLLLLADMVRLRSGREAQKLLERAWNAAPGEVAAPSALVEHWLERRQLNRALAVALEMDGRLAGASDEARVIACAEALSSVAEALARSGRMSEAERLLRRAVDRDPSVERLLALAALFDEGERYAEAAELYARAIAPSGEDPTLVSRAVRGHLRAGKPRAAGAYVDLLLAHPGDGRLVDALLGAASALTEAGDHGQAARVLAAAYLRSAGRAEVGWLWAQSLDRSGRREEAVKCLQEVLARDPRHEPSLAALAGWLAEGGEETAAERPGREVAEARSRPAPVENEEGGRSN